MARWQHPIAIDPDAAMPVFLQIARAIAEDVRRGRLRRGDAVPASRALADEIGVHRNTVLAAYRELTAEGWLQARAGSGTFISSELPDATPRAFAPRATSRDRLGFEVEVVAAKEAPNPPRGTLVLASGSPDARLVPTDMLARAYRRALRLSGPTLLSYGDPRGALRLREALAAMLSHLRGLPADASSFLVTRGSQGAIDLVARALLKPGDVVAVESLGYRPAWGAFEAAGAKLVAVPLDEHGIRVDAIPKGIRAVYVTPHHQFPTTVTLSPGRRIALLDRARVERFAIIEDDYDFEFHYRGRPVLPLASADRAGVVVHIGTLSKILAPGLRIGFVVAPTPLLDKLAAIRTLVDRQGDHAIEHAVAELLEDSEVQRHVRRVKKLYRERRDVLVDALHEQLSGVVSVEPPAGGMALWVGVDPAVNVDEWATRALAAGVAFQPARGFAFDGRSRPFARVGFAALDPRELREAVKRMASALKPSPSPKRSRSA